MQLLGINVGEGTSVAQSFVTNFGLTYPVLSDPQQQAYAAYALIGSTPFPVDVIIDQSGIVRYIHTEYDPYTMVNTIDDLLVSNLQSNEYKLDVRIYDLKNYPNPFNPATNISFTIKQKSFIKLEIFDLTGKLISVLENDIIPPGNKSYIFSAQEHASGIYFYRLSVNEKSVIRRMLLIH